MRWLAAMLVTLVTFSGPSFAVSCEEISHAGTRYTVCEVDPRKHKLALFLRDADGEIYGQFTAIDTALAKDNLKLSFAMNAGMYHEDRSPVGLYVEDGKEEMRVVTNAGPGNFGLLPNGVLCLSNERAEVLETLKYVADAPDCTHATQSGPMLVIDGKLHPRFLVDGTSKYIRNGVGTSSDGTRAVFAISEEPVNFYDFGTLFRDVLGTPNALYLDGNISRLYAPELGRRDFGFALGPIVGVVEKLP